MILNQTRTGYLLNWAAQGTQKPTSTNQVFDMLYTVRPIGEEKLTAEQLKECPQIGEAMVRDLAHDICYSTNGANDARDASKALKTRFEEASTAPGPIPTAHLVRQLANQVVLCGTMSGALDSALQLGRDSVSSPETASLSHKAIYDTAADVIESARTARYQPNGRETLKTEVSHGREQCAAMVDALGGFAGQSEPQAVNAFRQGLTALFALSYGTGVKIQTAERAQMMA